MSHHMAVLSSYRSMVAQQLKQPKIAIVGDAMLDLHITCDVLGISPEDDLAWKLKAGEARATPGGAANVAMNLQALGAEVKLIASAADDHHGNVLDGLIRKQVEAPLRPLSAFWLPCPVKTTVKSRYLTKHGRHIVRIDDEATHDPDPVSLRLLIEQLTKFKPDLIVVSDYAKGVISPEVTGAIENLGIPYIVDPKGPLTDYGGPRVITPNEKEFARAVTGCETVRYHPDNLVSQITEDGPENILVTMGGDGAILYTLKPLSDIEVNKPIYRRTEDFKAHKRTHGDPTGCGDSLIAGLAYALAWNWELSHAIRLGIAAGSCAFGRTGVYVVTPQDLIKELEKGDPNNE